jgi:hypothetical protein
MGTLFNQSIRKFNSVSSDEIDSRILQYKKLAAKHNISLGEVIQIADLAAYEYRTLFLVDDGDRRDEQLAGFGGLIQSLMSLLQDYDYNINKTLDIIADAIREK